MIIMIYYGLLKILETKVLLLNMLVLSLSNHDGENKIVITFLSLSLSFILIKFQ
jgi:hypothetical protein